MKGKQFSVFCSIRSGWHAQKIVNEVCREYKYKRLDVTKAADKMLADKNLTAFMNIHISAQNITVDGKQLDYLGGFLLSPHFNATHIGEDHYVIDAVSTENVVADLKELAAEWGWKTTVLDSYA